MGAERAKEDEDHDAYNSFKKFRKRAKKEEEPITIEFMAPSSFGIFLSSYISSLDSSDPMSSGLAMSITKRVDIDELSNDT